MKRKTILTLTFVTLLGLGCAAAFAHSFETSRNAATGAAAAPAVASEGSTTDQAAGDLGTGKITIPIRRILATPIPDSLGGPKSLSELVGSANVIVIGRITSLLATSTFYGYDAGASKAAAIDKANGSRRLGIPIADYAISIEQVLLSDGAAQTGGQLILRVPGTPGVDSGMPELGSRRLFFLTMNPDARTYSMPSVLDEIDLAGSTTIYQAGGADIKPFGMTLSPDDFVSSVQQEIGRQTGTPSE